LTGAALAGRAAACEGDNPEDDTYSFNYTGQAIAPNPTEIKVRDSCAYLSTNDSVSVVDVSNPQLPVLVERADAPETNAPIRDWRDLKIGTIGGTPVVAMSQDNGNPAVSWCTTPPTRLTSCEGGRMPPPVARTITSSTRTATSPT
jgi:hypothetical protein